MSALFFWQGARSGARLNNFRIAGDSTGIGIHFPWWNIDVEFGVEIGMNLIASDKMVLKGSRVRRRKKPYLDFEHLYRYCCPIG